MGIEDVDNLTEQSNGRSTAIDQAARDPVRRRWPGRPRAAGRGGGPAGCATSTSRSSCVANKCDTPALESAGGRVLQARPAATSSASAPSRIAAGPSCSTLIDDCLPAAEACEAHAEGRGPEAGHRRPAQHRQEHVHQQPGRRASASSSARCPARRATASTSASSATARRSSPSTRPACARRAACQRHRVLQPGPRRALDPPGRRGAAVLRRRTRTISKVDKQLAEYILEQHKPAIFVVNKWDLMVPMPTGKMGRLPAQDVPEPRLRADRVHHGQGRQERASGARTWPRTCTSRPAPASAPATSTACCARRWTTRRRRCGRTAGPRSTTPRRSAPIRRPSCCSPTARSCSTTPISAISLKTFRDQLPFHDVPIKLYLLHKRHGAAVPAEGGPRRRRGAAGAAAEGAAGAASQLSDQESPCRGRRGPNRGFGRTSNRQGPALLPRGERGLNGRERCRPLSFAVPASASPWPWPRPRFSSPPTRRRRRRPKPRPSTSTARSSRWPACWRSSAPSSTPTPPRRGWRSQADDGKVYPLIKDDGSRLFFLDKRSSTGPCA